jgi:hypothetical protein
MSKTRADGAPSPHPREFLLEQLAFEPESVEPGVRAHVAGCQACSAAVAGLDAGRQAFVAARPVRPFVSTVVAQAERKEQAEAGAKEELRRARFGWLVALLRPRWLLVPALAGAAVVLVIAVPRQPAEEGNHTHFKGGGATLRLFYARGPRETAQARPLDPGVSLRPGDLLRFGVLAGKGRYAQVASVDEAGRVSRYYPAGDAASPPLPASGELQLLPGSIELDETLGREWVVLFLSERPLDGPRVTDALLAAFRARTGDRLGPIAAEAETDVMPITKVRP